MGSQEYRSWSTTQYAAYVNAELESFGRMRGMDEKSITALKLTLFMESGARWDAVPVKRYSAKHYAGLSEAARSLYVKSDHGNFYYKLRHDYNPEKHHSKYVTSTTAYSAFQLTDSNRGSIFGMPEFIAPLFEYEQEHPFAQARYAVALSTLNDGWVQKSLTNAGYGHLNPSDKFGIAYQYMQHFMGAGKMAQFTIAHELNPDTPISKVLTGAAMRANANITLTDETGKKIKFKDFSVSNFVEWVEKYKYAKHITNVAKAEFFRETGREATTSDELQPYRDKIETQLGIGKSKPSVGRAGPTEVDNILQDTQRIIDQTIKELEALTKARNESQTEREERDIKLKHGIEMPDAVSGILGDLFARERTAVAGKVGIPTAVVNYAKEGRIILDGKPLIPFEGPDGMRKMLDTIGQAKLIRIDDNGTVGKRIGEWIEAATGKASVVHPVRKSPSNSKDAYGQSKDIMQEAMYLNELSDAISQIKQGAPPILPDQERPTRTR